MWNSKLINVYFNWSALKITVKTTQKSDIFWSAIFRVIIYYIIIWVYLVNKRDVIRYLLDSPVKHQIHVVSVGTQHVSVGIQLSPCIICVQYIGGCSIHQGMFSTSGDVQYIRGCIVTLYNVCSVHRGMFSTSGDVQCIGKCSVHRGGYHEYIRGIPWVHRGDTMSTSGDIMSTSGDVQYIGGYHDTCGDIMSTSGGYHEYTGGCSVHRSFQ